MNIVNWLMDNIITIGIICLIIYFMPKIVRYIRKDYKDVIPKGLMKVNKKTNKNMKERHLSFNQPISLKLNKLKGGNETNEI